MSANQQNPAAQLSSFLARFPPPMVTLATRCLSKLRRALPVSHQLVYNYSSSVVVAFGMSERGYEAIVALAVSPRWVRLYLDKSLPDPSGILEGAGAAVRSATITSASDLDRAEIKTLIKAAISRAGVELPRSGTARMIIKSASKRSATKRPATKKSASKKSASKRPAKA